MPNEVPTKRIRILLGDEPSMWRDGLRAILATQTDLEVVGGSDDTGPVLPHALKYRPDLVLCDSSTGESTVADLKELRARGVCVQIMVFCSSAELMAMPKPLLLEIAAVIPKSSPTEALLNSIRKVNQGEMIPKLPEPLPPAAKEPSKAGALSKRELQLVGLIALGYRNREIADKLFISEQTVKNHLHNVFDKTGIRDRLELAMYAVYHGFYEQ